MADLNASNPDSSSIAVEPLIVALKSKNAAEREKAREQLVEVGHEALIPLLRCLSDDNEHVRWEAAKALEGIADPAAADALAESLNDESAGVR